MVRIFIALLPLLLATPEALAGLAYRFEITTAYAAADPFPNRIDSNFTASDTGYLQIVNTGSTDYSGIIRVIAHSALAGNLGFDQEHGFIAAGASVSIGIANDASDVGGFNGQAYTFRPGIVIYLEGTITDGTSTAPVKLGVQDLDIHSGVFRTDPNGLVTDDFVLQGGDPFGFDNGDAFEVSQAQGRYTLQGVVPEPATLGMFGLGLCALLAARARRDPLRA